MPRASSPMSIVGYLSLEPRTAGKVWVAKLRTAEGPFTRKVLGPAWARDTGRRTQRGGRVWRAADGPCPEGHLTPKAADAALEELLALERARSAGGAVARSGGKKTFADAT